MKKRILSVMMAVVLLVSNISGSVLATEEGASATETVQIIEAVQSEDTSESVEIEVAEEPAAEESMAEEAKEEEPAVEETKEEEPAVEESEKEEEKVCEEGCILTGEEHDECFVWIACTMTEGCEGPKGHEGECYGVALYAEEGGTITVSNAKNAYIVVGVKDGSRNDTLYKTNSSGVICDLSGSIVTFEEGTYYIWYGTAGATANRSFYNGSVTVDSSSESVRLSTARNSTASTASAITEDQWNWATCVYYNTSKCDHIHIRVAGSYTIDIGGNTYNATVSNPSITVYVNGAYNTSKSWSGTTNYEWTYKTNISLSSEIAVYMKLDLTYADASGTHTLEDVEIIYNNVKDRDRWIEFIAICDGIQGFDFTVSVQDIQEVINYYNVIYQWRVYHLDGSVSTDLPASLGAHGLPASASGLQDGSEYVYNTGYVEGTSYYDYENGLLYTFHGWDTYSHSSVFNVDPTATGYEALDDGDSDASNNKKIPITADTWINGYWTVSELEPAEAYLMVKKVVEVDGDAAYVKNYLQNISKLYISIDPGIDKNGDDASQVDVDYPAATSENGYRIDVYQYDTPFIFNEYQAEVPGYTRNTVISTSGLNLSLVSEDAATVTGTKAVVDIDEEYDPNQAPYNLGTVIYTNTYKKNVGTPILNYPSLTLLKSAADTGNFQSGVEFTLYSDQECKTPVTNGVYTTDENGLVNIGFEGFQEGTYYLKETKANVGYVADDAVYKIVLKADETVEEMKWNDTEGKYEYVEVTYYTLTVEIPEGSSSIYKAEDKDYHRLHIYNEPILGNLNVTKEITDADGNKITDEEMLANLDIAAIVHGPLVKDADGNIIGLGNTWQLNLNQENNFSASLKELAYGEYLIHESFASVHGYTWNGAAYKIGVTEAEQKEHYNNIKSVLFAIEKPEQNIDISIINTYSEWEKADFYIKKTDESGKALAGAAFTLYTDESCTTEALSGQGYTVSATTGADGYAYFNGFTASEGAITTFYMKETKAPAGYLLSDTVYKVQIKAVAKSAVTTFETKIAVKDSSGEWVEAAFDSTTDLLTVVNYPVLGKLTITKELIGAPADVTEILVQVNGPEDYSKEVVLNSGNSYSATLENLSLGTYTIREQDMNRPGYSLDVKYKVNEKVSSAGAAVEISEENVSGSVSITNTYTKNEAVYEVPTMLTVKKVAEDGTTPLAGAVFRLDRMDAAGEEVIQSVSFTTNEEGIVIFDMLSGFITNNEPVEGKYILSETKSPDGYEASTETWTITVKEDDGKLRVVLNEDKNIFENFWDWIVGEITGVSAKWENNMLTVPNVRKVGDLTITKAVVDEKGYYTDAEYSFKLDCSDDAFDQTFVLKAGKSYTVKGIPWGTTYTLTEDVTNAAFTSVIEDAGNGVIAAYDTAVVVTNTYHYDDTANIVLNLLKVDADDQKKVLSGAGFTLYADSALTEAVGEEVFTDEYGKVSIAIKEAGTYYLKETTSPKGYLESEEVYIITAEEEYVVKNAGTEQAVTVIETKISVKNSSGENVAGYDLASGLLTVANNPVLGKLTITKELIGAPADVTEILVQVNGPKDYSKEVVLNSGNSYSATLENLSLGTYTVREQDMNRPGYSLDVKYKVNETVSSAGAEVEISEENVSGSVSITNTYTKNEVVYEVPTMLTVKKVAEDNTTPLAGAVFKLDKLNGSGGIIHTTSLTTNEEGIVIFDLLSGFITNNEPVEGKYNLSEAKAPEGYEASTETWTVTVKEDDGKLRVVLNKDKNIFENFWDWTVGEITGVSAKWENNMLTVPNVRKVGDLTITKAVVDEKGHYSDVEYSFTLDCSDDAFDQTFVLKAGESYTVKDVPWGTTYTLTEDVTNAAFTSVIEDAGNGVIAAYDTAVVVTNTYHYDDTANIVLNLLKVDADDQQKVLSGAGFTLYADSALTEVIGEEVFTDESGKVSIAIESAGTYYLKETTSPEGYLENEEVYTITAEEEYVVKNAGTEEAVTEIQINLSVEGLSEVEESTYLVENTAADDDDEDKDDDDDDDKDDDDDDDKDDGDKDDDKDDDENNSADSGKKPPKTGDNNNLFGLGIQFILSLIALCAVIAVRIVLGRREER